MKTLANKRILLGVTGGIAAYKSADLVRRLRERGADVRVVMTRGACEFITPLTMQALSGEPVHTALLDHSAESAMGHIQLARWSDVILVAPASANFIAKLRQGLADDLLSTLCLASNAPMLIAPAMNQQMWMNPATQENTQTLVERGIGMIGPADGEQACGEVGPGRMIEPIDILKALEQLFHTGLLNGLNVMITAGPTQEAIDPVRYLSNRSSGRMGFAIAAAAIEAGAAVTLVSGPVSMAVPEKSVCVAVKSALQMHQVVMKDIHQVDIFIAAAAVADYRCIDIQEHKIKKSEEKLNLTLEKNPDILMDVAKSKNPPFTVGFAAETDELEKNALDKLNRKSLDMIAANKVGDGLGFEAEENTLDLYWNNGHKKLDKAHKEKIARELIGVVANRYYAKDSIKAH
jgi:phosphopantothenoylcysteine decarboxylase/phosphopantothenate--cysteine ligase